MIHGVLYKRRSNKGLKRVLVPYWPLSFLNFFSKVRFIYCLASNPRPPCTPCPLAQLFRRQLQVLKHLPKYTAVIIFIKSHPVTSLFFVSFTTQDGIKVINITRRILRHIYFSTITKKRKIRFWKQNAISSRFTE